MAGTTNLFAGRASDIVRVLLVNYPKTWALRPLAREAGVSLGWASKVATALIKERLAIREPKGAELRLMNPFDLLRRWASFRNFASNTRFVEYYTPEEDISAFFGKVGSRKGPDYAFTCLAGALLVAPFVRPTNTHIYVRSEADAGEWARLLGLSPVEENGNVKFAIAESSGVFYGSTLVKGGVRVVSDVQLYADLLNYPARGEEAAGAIYKIIDKRWKKGAI